MVRLLFNEYLELYFTTLLFKDKSKSIKKIT